MRVHLVCAMSLLFACKAKPPPGPPDVDEAEVPAPAEPDPADAADDRPSADTSAEARSGGVPENTPCEGPDDCKGDYCKGPPFSGGEAKCTKSPDIMNGVILCKEDAHCKDLCVAFKGSPKCGQEEGTCNCDGPPSG